MSNITANPSRAVGVFNADVCKTIQLSLTFQNMSSFDIVHFRIFFKWAALGYRLPRAN